MASGRVYKCPLCHPEVHMITRKEKHQYVTRSISAVAKLTNEIAKYSCLNAASTSDHYSTTRMQYKMIKVFTNIYKISVCRLREYGLQPVHNITDHEFLPLQGPLKHHERSTIIINLSFYIHEHLHILLNEISDIDKQKMWMEKYDNTLVLFKRIAVCLKKFVLTNHDHQCGTCYYNQTSV